MNGGYLELLHKTMSPISIGILCSSSIRIAGANVQYTGTSNSVVAGATQTGNTTPIGPASADRLVVALIRWGQNAADRSLSTVTIGGNAATVHSQGHAGGGGSAIASVAISSGTTASVVCVFSNTVNAMRVDLFALTGLNSQTPLDVQTDTTLTSSHFDITLNTQAGGVVLGVVSALAGTPYTWTGITEFINEEPIDVANAIGGSALGTNFSTPTQLVQLTITPFGGDVGWMTAGSWR